MKKSFYSVLADGFKEQKRIALVTDLHAQSYKRVTDGLLKISPDYILMAGDILEALDGSSDEINERAFGIFAESAKIAPTFYVTGNHEDGGVHSGRKKWREYHSAERVYTEKNLQRIKDSGVHFLLDSYEIVDGIAFGGLASGLILENSLPNLDFLEEFAALDAPKVLLCHHPEYYGSYVKKYPIDLTVSGHAHGGQWRFFGRGMYAPGQGIFPKYTSGVHEGRFVISKGLKRTIIPPRIFNPTEIVVIDIKTRG
ncbi:MAG: hypothetical protein E7642_01790 [Ruminococcaceae bacterium]|nr:hypothetical protein [Oscillospiraceae bacterium]